MIGLIGTNGAGKSTLLNAIGGFVPADGAVGSSATTSAAFRRTVAPAQGSAAPSSPAKLFPELTVRETVQLALEARGARRRSGASSSTCRRRR